MLYMLRHVLMSLNSLLIYVSLAWSSYLHTWSLASLFIHILHQFAHTLPVHALLVYTCMTHLFSITLLPNHTYMHCSAYFIDIHTYACCCLMCLCHPFLYLLHKLTDMSKLWLYMHATLMQVGCFPLLALWRIGPMDMCCFHGFCFKCEQPIMALSHAYAVYHDPYAIFVCLEWFIYSFHRD